MSNGPRVTPDAVVFDCLDACFEPLDVVWTDAQRSAELWTVPDVARDEEPIRRIRWIDGDKLRFLDGAPEAVVNEPTVIVNWAPPDMSPTGRIRFYAQSALSGFETLAPEDAIENASYDLREILAVLDEAPAKETDKC